MNMNPTPAHTRVIAALAGSLPVAAMAGGGMTGGSTEVTQIANKLQLAMAYAKQVAQHVTELATPDSSPTSLKILCRCSVQKLAT